MTTFILFTTNDMLTTSAMPVNSDETTSLVFLSDNLSPKFFNNSQAATSQGGGIEVNEGDDTIDIHPHLAD